MSVTPQPLSGLSEPLDDADTFAARYCGQRGLARAAYAESVLRAALYPHARILRWALPERALAVDRAFVDRVGHVRRARELHDELRDFVMDPADHTWLRDVLHLRVSARRLRRLVRETFEAEGRGGRLETKEAAMQ